MSEVAQSVKKADSQLPAINYKDQNGSINNEISRSEDDGNVLPLTHNNKRRKNRKKFRKHSPEYYEQKKVEKFNKKLVTLMICKEQKWDSHFINDHIPDIYGKKKKEKLGKTLSKLTSEKRSITPLNPKAAGDTTGNFVVKKDSLPFPKISNPSKRSNSFNVHVVPQKPTILTQKAQKRPQQPKQTKAQLKPPSEQTKNRQRTSQQSRRPIDLQKAKEKSLHLQEYRKALNDLHEETKFSHCHKEALQMFLDAIERKSVRDLLDKEFNLIRKKESLVYKVNNAIINREKMLQKVNLSGPKLIKDDKQTLELIDHYRTSTLAVVEEILKWKETWHALYYEVFKKSKSFDFLHQTQNYLLTLMSSTDDILRKISKQKKQRKREKTQHKHEITEQFSPKKQQKTEQKLNKSQQIQIKPAENQKTPLKKQSIVNQTVEKDKPAQKQTIIPSTNIESPSKAIPENSPIKQLNSNTQPIKKPIIKTQAQQSTFNSIQNDPFLISLHSIGKQDKNIILKIRACELLLIEETFNYMKK